MVGTLRYKRSLVNRRPQTPRFEFHVPFPELLPFRLPEAISRHFVPLIALPYFTWRAIQVGCCVSCCLVELDGFKDTVAEVMAVFNDAFEPAVYCPGLVPSVGWYPVAESIAFCRVVLSGAGGVELLSLLQELIKTTNDRHKSAATVIILNRIVDFMIA
jgi:hypothetical protein